MNKIYEAYRLNKKYFYLLLFIYLEIIFAFCFELFSNIFSTMMTSPGNAGIITIELSLLGSIIFDSIFIILILLLLIPPILLTIKGVKDKLNIVQIAAVWICVLVACILGFILVNNDISLVGKFVDFLFKFLNDRFHLFTQYYTNLM